MLNLELKVFFLKVLTLSKIYFFIKQYFFNFSFVPVFPLRIIASPSKPDIIIHLNFIHIMLEK